MRVQATKDTVIKGGGLLLHAVARGLALAMSIRRESRQPKADKEREGGPGAFTYGQPTAGEVAPACFIHPHPYGREQRIKMAQPLSHQIAGCSRGGSPRSLPSAGRVTKTRKQKGTKKGPKASNKTKQSTKAKNAQKGRRAQGAKKQKKGQRAQKGQRGKKAKGQKKAPIMHKNRKTKNKTPKASPNP